MPIKDTLKKGFEKSEEELNKKLNNSLDDTKQDDDNVKSRGLFVIKTMNEWIEDAMKEPIPKMLFSEFWFEGEVCVLFAQTNKGKTILAFQIADSITRGIAILGLKLEAKAQNVLYLDFELSEKQIEKRYSEEYTKHFQFDEKFKRARFDSNPEIVSENEYDKLLFQSIEQIIIESKAKIIIIDNITYLNEQTEKASRALPLMKYLKTLKDKLGLSILILAHTPKIYALREIIISDLQGSSMIGNFIDSAFAIGKGKAGNELRYIKQMKQRSSEELYGSDNVLVFNIEKEHNFLGFVYQGTGTERELLKTRTESELNELDENIIALKKSKPSISYREIGRQLGTNHTRVKRVWERHSSQLSGTDGTSGTAVPSVPPVPKNGITQAELNL